VTKSITFDLMVQCAQYTHLLLAAFTSNT